MVILEVGFDAPQDFHRILDRRLVHIDLLETTRKGTVFFEMLAEFLVGGRPHGAQLAARKRGFQQVGGIHRAAGCGTGTDNGVDLVDEQDGVVMFFQFGHDGFQAFFEITAVAGAGQQRAHVERVDRGLGQDLGRFTGNDLARQPFGDGGFPDAGVAHQQRVVLAAAAQHLNAAFHLVRPADQRINVAFAGFRVQINGVFRQRGFFLVAIGDTLGFFLVIRRTGHRAWFTESRILGDAMRGIKPYFEDHHSVKYTSDAIRTSVELAHRYINDRKLPDSAIDVIDEAGAAQHLLAASKRRKTIGTKEVEAVVAKIARIPPKNVSKDDVIVLKDLEASLKRVVFGQDKAIEALSSAIKLARAGLREPEKPIGNYLFAGPTGVGKTEVAKQLADTLGVELLRFDMSEYMEKHAVSRLIGAPPGYVGFDQGGMLTDGVDQHPHCVLLLDEMEKAHPDVYNILLQVMDHGKLTDHNGRTVDFRNVVLIMTSNAGASEQAKEAIGFGRDRRTGEDTAAIERTFTPEFRNRLDAVISFAPLPKEVILRVVEKFVLQLEAQLMDRNVTIELSTKAAEWLGDKGYDARMGARPLGRVIQEHIKKPLAEELLFGKLAKGGVVKVNVKKGELDLTILGSENPKLTGNKPPLLTAE